MSKNILCRCLTTLLLAVVVSACSLGTQDERRIDTAQGLILNKPDSALLLLDSIFFPENLNDDYFNKYTLSRIQAKDKRNQSIKDDTLIFRANAYYTKKNDTDNTLQCAFYVARVWDERGEREKAMQAYTEAAHLAEGTTNVYLKAQIQTFIGELYTKQLLTQRARDSYREALVHFQTIDDKKNIIESYNRIGSSFLQESDTDSASYYYNKGLGLAILQNDAERQAYIYQNIGVTSLHSGEYAKARRSLNRAVVLYEDNTKKAKTYLSIAITFNRENNRDSALYYIDKISELDKKKENAMLQANISNVLASIEENDKNYQQALTHKKEYIRHVNKQLTDRNNQAIMEIQKKYNYEQTRNENNRLTILKQRTTIMSLALGMVLILLFSIFLWSRNKYKEEILVAERNIYKLVGMAESYNEEKISMRDIILDHFNIFKKTALMDRFLREEEKKYGLRLLSKFNETVYGQESFDWEKTYKTLDLLYNKFCEKLREAHPNLDESEFRICCLTYASLNNTDIAIITNYKTTSIQAKKYSIRKKLGIVGYGNIKNYLDKQLFGIETTDETADEAEEKD